MNLDDALRELEFLRENPNVLDWLGGEKQTEADRLIEAGAPYAPQPGPQESLLACECQEIFFGGARGGGKSYGFLIDWLEHRKKHGKHARGILFRRQFTDLEDIIEESKGLFPKTGGHFNESKAVWRWPDGSIFRFRYIKNDNDANKYIGHQYTWLAVEEAGTFATMDPIKKLRATLRSAHSVPVRMLVNSNPGGVGHNWLKARYIDPAKPHTPLFEDGETSGWTRIFIPAQLKDNLILMRSDPGYADRIRTSGIPTYLVEAWLHGNWDIVAGGMFDDLFTSARARRIVLPWFRVPKQWRIDRSLDWGNTMPFSVGWWATSDGTPVTIPGRGIVALPRGSLIRIGEWYGWKSGKPNVGCEMLSRDVAREIIEREKMMGYTVRKGPAGADIFGSDDGPSVEQEMAREGIHWISSSACAIRFRKPGWEQMRRMFMAAIETPREDPGLFVFDTCRQFLRTVPLLPRDLDGDPEDVDTNAEDHIADEVRYRCTVKVYNFKAKGLAG